MADVAALHREMIEAVTARDLDRLRDTYHADYVYQSSDGEEQKGPDAGVAVAELYNTAFPDLRLEIVTQTVEGNRSVVEFRASGTNTGPLGDLPPTGRAMDVVVCNVITEQDGKIIRESEYFDQYSFLQKLGVIEA